MSNIYTKKPFDQLTITDDSMFTTVMYDVKNVKPLLEMIFKKKINKINIIEREKTIETGYDSRVIRMDVFVEDDENTVYDVEMQASIFPFLGKRFRYYQSAIDVDMVNKGEHFSKLKQSYIIFFTTYDPFGKGWYMYPFETLCIWDSSVKIEDSAQKIVLNAKGTCDKEGHEVSDQIKEVLAYMNGRAPASEYTMMLDAAINKIKQNEERRTDYMYNNTFKGDAIMVGDYMRIVKSIRGNNGLLSDNDIISFLKITPDLLGYVRKALSIHPDWDDEDIAMEVLSMQAMDEYKVPIT